MEDELAAGGGGVDLLVEAADPDPAVGQAGDGVDQVAQGATEAVELPDDQVSPGRSWSRSRSRAGRSLGAPLAVSVNTPVAAGRREGVDLELRLLVGGGDTGTAEQMTHARERRRTL
jgi:hypothetical protein